MKEFQRDHAVDGIVIIKDAVRLKADGSINDDTKKLISKQDPGRRPLFGTDARVDITDDDALKTALNNKRTYLSPAGLRNTIRKSSRGSTTGITTRERMRPSTPTCCPICGLEDYHPAGESRRRQAGGG